MVAYMGCVMNLEKANTEEAHQETFDALRNELNQEKYEQLTTLSFREAMKNDVSAFNENLAYYNIKSSYVRFIQLVYKLGFTLTLATVLPSLICVFLIVLILFFYLENEFKNSLLAGLISLLILYFPQTISLARISTPDAFSALILLLVALLYLKKSNWYLLLMLFSITVRTDNVIWCFMLLLLDTFFDSNPKRRYVLIASSVSCLALYFFLNAHYNNGGWEVLFYNSFVERQIFPLTTTPSLSLPQYLFTLLKKLPEHIPTFACLILFFLGIIKKVSIREFLSERYARLIIVCAATFCVRFILFPMLDFRYYYSFLLVLFVSIVSNRRALFAIDQDKKID